MMIFVELFDNHNLFEENWQASSLECFVMDSDLLQLPEAELYKFPKVDLPQLNRLFRLQLNKNKKFVYLIE